MKSSLKIIIFLVLLLGFNCRSKHKNYSENMLGKPESERIFNREKWQTKKGKDYPFREKMLNDVLYNDTVRTLHRNELLKMFGEPSYYREDSSYLHYIIKQKRLFSWPLHTKVMVIKCSDDNSVEWIKVHE